MNLLKKLWKDESGVILSAEAAVVGTVAVLGVSAGLSVVSTSVNQELQDVGFAIRSLDQSYEIPGQNSCRAQTAGSSFRQQPVAKSLTELCAVSIDVAPAGQVDSGAGEKRSKQAAPKEKEGQSQREKRHQHRKMDEKKRRSNE